MMRRMIFALLALAYVAPAWALDLQSTTVPGRTVPSLTTGEIANNRADKSLFFKNVDGTIGIGSLLNATVSGRKAVEQGDSSDLTIKPGGASVLRALQSKLLDFGVSVMDYGVGVGTGGDDAPAINAALQSACSYTQTNPAAKTCKILFPEPPSGAYNICSASVTLPGYWSTVFLQGMGAAPKIRIKPDCATPPQQVIYQAINVGDSSAARLHIDNLTLDGYCVSKYNIYLGYSVGAQITRSIFRNVAKGNGANVWINGGYEINIDKSNRAENVNEIGHTCYNSQADLPDYNFYTKSSDSWYGLSAVDARVANYYNANGGNNHYADAHGWGFLSAFPPYASGNLAPQYTFVSLGNIDINGAVLDSSQVAGVYLKGGADTNGNPTNASFALVSGTHMFGSPANTPAVLLDPGLTNAVIANNGWSNQTTAVATVSGAISPTITIANNGDANPASAPWTSYTPTLSCASGTLTSAKATGRFEKVGKRVSVTLNITITTSGTCAGNLNVTMPFANASLASAINGSERSANGKSLEGYMAANASVLSVYNYDNTSPSANGVFLVLSGSYETQ